MTSPTASRNGAFPHDARSAAELYLMKGLAPIPLPPSSKDPGYPNWQHLRLTIDMLDDHFPRHACRNVGILNGAPSSNALDVDLDCPEALLAAPQLLPPTGWVFGRKTSPRSHWVYRADRPLDAAQEKYTDLDGAVLVELRGTGGLTVFPPSTHKDTGESISWDRFGDPAVVTLVALQQSVREVAAVALLARHWPAKGTRQDTFLALAGGLLRAGWGQDRVERFVEALAAATRDDEPKKRIQVVALTAGKLEQDHKATGWPKVEERIGSTGKEVVRLIRVEVAPHVEQAYHDALDRLLALDFDTCDGEKTPHVLRPSEEGKAAWVAFYNAWAREQAGVEGELAAAFGKLEGYAARFALLHHVVGCIARGEDDLVPVERDSDESLLEAYQRGDDLHSRTARNVLRIEEVTKQHRQLAKALNFGLLYGMGARGFRQYAKGQYGLDLSQAEAVSYRDAFFKTYPGLAAWHRRVRSQKATQTRTLSGRRRLLDNTTPDTHRMNTPIQGTGADGLKLALALLWERREQAPGAFPVLAVHDEIVVEADADQAEAVVLWLKAAMIEAIAPLVEPVPVEVEVKVARTWGGD